MGFRLLLAAVACIGLMTSGLASARMVWVALAEAGSAYVEAADALRTEAESGPPGGIEWRVAHWAQFSRTDRPPDAVVVVGTAAQRGMQELFSRESTPPPMLAIMVPRVAFERDAEPSRLRAGSLSAVFLDQAAGRQLDLIRLAIPDARRVGVLFGRESASHVPPLERAARERGMQILVAGVEPAGLSPALQSLLGAIDILLALPDPSVFNGQTAGNILGAAYRQRLPLAGFSPAYVRAGALMALYSTPRQVGTRAGEVLRQILAGKPLPPPHSPREFTVSVNSSVARSLGLVLDEQRLAEQLVNRDKP